MKKRLFAMTLAGILCLGSLAGCGGNSDTPSNTTSDSTASAGSADESYNISVIVKLTDGHFQKVMAGAQAYADEHDNVSVEILSPTSATAYEEQLNMIETALSNESTDAVVLSPQQSDTATTLVANATKPVIALDTDFESDKKSTFVGTGNEEAAKQGGQTAVEEAKARGVENPTVVILTGVQGDETHDARLQGYTEGAEAAGGEVLEVQYCDALADRAALAMEGIIQKHPDGVDVVLSTNDDMVMAASKIIQDSGNENYAQTVLCGFDGNKPAIEAVQDGSIGLDVAQNGYDMGYKAVEAAVKVLEGEQVDSFIDSGATIVAADNCESFIQDMKDKGLWDA